jgi:hypothetical protein
MVVMAEERINNDTVITTKHHSTILLWERLVPARSCGTTEETSIVLYKMLPIHSFRSSDAGICYVGMEATVSYSVGIILFIASISFTRFDIQPENSSGLPPVDWVY